MEPNPPREVELLLPGDEVVELNGLRGMLTGPERNAVDGAMVELPRERVRSRSYEEYEPDPQCQLPHERRRRHGSSCARGVAPGTGAAAGAVCPGCRHSAERAGIM